MQQFLHEAHPSQFIFIVYVQGYFSIFLFFHVVLMIFVCVALHLIDDVFVVGVGGRNLMNVLYIHTLVCFSCVFMILVPIRRPFGLSWGTFGLLFGRH